MALREDRNTKRKRGFQVNSIANLERRRKEVEERLDRRWQPTPTVKVKGGIWYLDRNKVKLLPAGGIVWTPSAETRLDIFFPNPKLARRLSNMGNTEFWLFLAGEYGGGNWTIKRAVGPAAGDVDSVDYNDMRVGVGLEFNNPGRISGLFEVGVAFERELIYRNGPPDEFNPNTTVYLRAGDSRQGESFGLLDY